MRFGISLALDGSATAADLQRVARDAEEAGLDTLWVSDHIVLPTRWRFSEAADGHAPDRFRDRYRLEALSVLAHLAASTSTIGLGTSIVVLPQREPILFAKQAATIDHLSGGRLRLGVGVGWSAEEFAVLGADFDCRGRLTDSLIERCRALWCGDDPAVPTADGRFVEVDFAPRVPRAGGIPVLIGGSSVPAMRRAARLGDGWMPANAFATASTDAYAEMDRRFREALSAAGRARADVPVTLKVHIDPDGTDPEAVLRGSPTEIAGTIATYEALGVDELILDVRIPPSPDGARRFIAFLRDDVLSRR